MICILIVSLLAVIFCIVLLSRFFRDSAIQTPTAENIRPVCNRLKKAYEAAVSQIAVPSSAIVVGTDLTVFGLRASAAGSAETFYMWQDGDALCFFPRTFWYEPDFIAGMIGAAPSEIDENDVHQLRIEIERIDGFRIEPDPTGKQNAVLSYHSGSGAEQHLTLSESAVGLLRFLIPEKESR